MMMRCWTEHDTNLKEPEQEFGINDQNHISIYKKKRKTNAHSFFIGSVLKANIVFHDFFLLFFFYF